MDTELRMNELFLEVAESINELKDTSTESKFLSVEQASNHLNVSTSLIRKWILQNQIATYRFGKCVRLSIEDLGAIIRTSKTSLAK